MFEIMIYWMEPNAAGKWRMRSVIPEERLMANIESVVDWIKEGRASHFTVNKLDNFDNIANIADATGL